ncbi:hypothetical protein [Roseovarius spongiae]|uniref:hypothetical protein n=1 Tax=Roseovarius spongiae TaxID=2320272 RepID=UPI0011C4AB2E|nr:hypothetical protein [Roseovarius spongiae]
MLADSRALSIQISASFRLHDDLRPIRIGPGAPRPEPAFARILAENRGQMKNRGTTGWLAIPYMP